MIAVKSPTPQRTLVYGTTFPIPTGQLEYPTLVRRFITATRATAMAPGGGAALTSTASNGLRRGVRQVTDENLAQIIFSSGGMDSENIAVADWGQNLAWPQPKAAEAFRKWLQARALPLDFLDKTAKSWDDLQFSIAPETANTKPVLYYYSHLFAREFALSFWAERSAALKLAFPNAGITGGFENAPFGDVTSHIDAFRKGALTSPRIDLKDNDFYYLDLMYAGIRGRETNLDSKIYADVAFTPNTRPVTWRKRFYRALAHGAKIFDIGDFQPGNAQSPLALRRALGELRGFENIVQDGKLRPAQTALFVGETGDIWNNLVPARRTLYRVARASQLPLDMLTESDVLQGDLKQYKVLLLADRNINRKTAAAIAGWVQAGGTLIATAGAGMRDELNQRNIFLFEQWGVRELEYSESEKPLANADSIDTVKWAENTFPVFDTRSRFDAGSTEILATFSDGSPAVISQRVGEGTAVYAGFWPRPGSEKGGVGATTLMEFVLKRVPRPVVCYDAAKEISDVETSVIESRDGIVIPLINKGEKPFKKIAVRIPFLTTFKTCTLASGGEVVTNRDTLGLIATLELNDADALIFK